jgi:hypothetical protein
VNLKANGRTIKLAASQVLGVGGEATVFAADPTTAAKVWHTPTTTQVRKLQALLDLRPSLPTTLLAPRERLEDTRGQVVGFLMNRLPAGFEPFALTMKRATTAPLGATLRCLAHLSTVLAELHQRGAVVGDLSDQNVVFAGEEIRLIDVDSIQIGGHPCPVGTEATLDPTLYGVDLSRAPAFTVQTDAYALAVLAFRALLHVHPYGGVHPRLATLPDRAAHGVSVFDKEVVYPAKIARPLETLAERTLDTFREVFAGGARPLLPAGFFDALREDLVLCATCAQIFSRERTGCAASCPACTSQSTVPTMPPRAVSPRQPAPSKTGLRVQLLLEVRGEIVAAALTPDGLVAVVREGSRLLRCDTSRRGRTGDEVLVDEHRHPLHLAPSARVRVVVSAQGEVAVALSGPDEDTRLWVYPAGEPVTAALVTTTRHFDKEPVFTFSGEAVVRLCSDMVLAGSRRGSSLVERALAPALPGQTFLDEGPHPAGVVLGFTRVFRAHRFFRSTQGSQLDLAVTSLGTDPATHEILDEVALLDDHGRTLCLRHTTAAGVPFARFDLLDARGSLMAAHRQRRDASPLGTSQRLRGRLIKNGVVLHPTAHGIVREELRHGALGPLTRLDETEPYVSEHSTLLAHPRGVVVLSGGTATLLER